MQWAQFHVQGQADKRGGQRGRGRLTDHGSVVQFIVETEICKDIYSLLWSSSWLCRLLQIRLQLYSNSSWLITAGLPSLPGFVFGCLSSWLSSHSTVSSTFMYAFHLPYGSECSVREGTLGTYYFLNSQKADTGQVYWIKIYFEALSSVCCKNLVVTWQHDSSGRAPT
jgi:hypothetical protein